MLETTPLLEEGLETNPHDLTPSIPELLLHVVCPAHRMMLSKWCHSATDRCTKNLGSHFAEQSGLLTLRKLLEYRIYRLALRVTDRA